MSATPFKSRYPGSIAFAKEDQALFFGREKELKKLYDLLQIKKMLILFSASGMGKSSLINAGLIPLMERRLSIEQTIPVPVRFWYYDQQLDKDPRALVNKIITQLRNRRQHLPPVKIPILSNVREDSLWYELKLFALNKIKVILIIDQSEEIFDYMPEQIEVLKDELYSIFSGVPQTVDEQCSREVLQLEKTIKDDAQLMQLDKDVEFIYGELNTKVLMVIRDDKLGYFNAFTDYFPDMLKDSYKLLPLSRDAAANAITLPAAVPGDFVSKQFTYTQEAIGLLLNSLEEKKKKGTFDPFTIQIICRFIEKTVIVQQHKSEVNPVDIPDMSKPVKRYIDDIWKNLPVVFGKEFVKERIEKKLIEHDRGSRISAHENINWIKPEVSAYLVNQGFLKRDRRENLDYLELSHDRLVPPLSKDYQSRMVTWKQLKWLGFGVIFLATVFYLGLDWITEEKNLINRQLLNRSDSLIKQLDSATESSITTLKTVSQQNDTGAPGADSNPVTFSAVDSSLNKLLLKKYNKQLYKVDIFYANPEQLHQFPVLADGGKTADSILQVLSKQRNFVVRKRMLRSVSGRFRTAENIIWYNGDEELQQANDILALMQQAYGEKRLSLKASRTSSRSENYLSIVIKNIE